MICTIHLCLSAGVLSSIPGSPWLVHFQTFSFESPFIPLGGRGKDWVTWLVHGRWILRPCLVAQLATNDWVMILIPASLLHWAQHSLTDLTPVYTIRQLWSEIEVKLLNPSIRPCSYGIISRTSFNYISRLHDEVINTSWRCFHSLSFKRFWCLSPQRRQTNQWSYKVHCSIWVQSIFVVSKHYRYLFIYSKKQGC